jgi:hypothetical protein
MQQQLTSSGYHYTASVGLDAGSAVVAAADYVVSTYDIHGYSTAVP